MIGISVLGSTGSIGQSTLDVIARHPDKFKAVALAAQRNSDKLFEQCQAFEPDLVAMEDATAAAKLAQRIQAAGLKVQVLTGTQGVVDVALHPQSQQVMAAIVGSAGLQSTLAAAQAGKRILLANKESLVMAGQLLMDAVMHSGAELLPIDSEHNAIFQSLPRGGVRGFEMSGVEKILLTASGGPFLGKTRDELQNITPEQAIVHPNWSMGKKISVDSATLMNKGLELIEACWLFDVMPKQIEVVVHKQSVIHSMVSYTDGSVIAQMGNPDMRTPIAYGMAYPDRIDAGVVPLDLIAIAQLDFELPDNATFPALTLAAQAFEAGGTATTILNAANEVAVAAFLDGKLPFLDIAHVVEKALEGIETTPIEGLESIWAADKVTREYVKHNILYTALA